MEKGIIKYALIVAGGIGTRMKSSIPKQFLCLSGRPILMHTMEAFHSADKEMEVTLVLPHTQLDFWKTLCKKHEFVIKHRLVEGGTTRGQSVINGLRDLQDSGVVAIHDGVRPFVSNEIIIKSFEVASLKGTCIAAVDLKDSIREVDKTGNRAVDRNNFKIVQTPQTFKVGLIREAYKQIGSINLSDDATVAEQAGFQINLIEGSYVNIKITTLEDLIFAEAILKS